MSKTIKIVMEIPKETYLEIRDGLSVRNAIASAEAIKNGIPLDDVKAEIEKEIIPRNSDDYDHDAMYQNCGLRIALKIIDNIGKGE